MPLSSCSSWTLAWTGGGGTLFFTARAPRIPVGTRHGEDEVYFFLGAVARSLAHCPPARDPSAPARLSLSQHATCRGGRLSTDLGIDGAPAAPHSLRVGSRSTGCSNSHRLSS